MSVFGTIFFAFADEAPTACSGCIVRFVGGGRTYTITSQSGGAYAAQVAPGPYAVSYSCTSTFGGQFWVPSGSVNVLAVSSYKLDVVIGVCL